MIARGCAAAGEGAPRDRARFARIAGLGRLRPGRARPSDAGPERSATGWWSSPADPASLLGAAAPRRPRSAPWQRAGRRCLAPGRRRRRPGAGGRRWSGHRGRACGLEADRAAACGPCAARRAGAAPLALDGPPSLAWGGYAIPTREGVLFGATHDRGDAEPRGPGRGSPAQPRTSWPRGCPAWPNGWRDAAAGRARGGARRHARPPAAGRRGGAGEGLFVLTGLGGRGFTLAPLLAEAVAALALGLPSPLPAALAGRRRSGALGNERCAG